MAHPYIFHANFEQGTNAEWDSETDTANQLDFPHYTELARFPNSVSTPFSGAYCMRAALTGGTADAFVLEGDINIAAATRSFVKFDIWFSSDFTGTADDTFSLFEAQQTDNTIEAAFGARIVAATDVINLGIGELAPTSFMTESLSRNVWYTVELDILIDNAGNNDGTIDLFVTRAGTTAVTTVAATQVASLDQLAVGQGVLGVQDHASTTTGTILFDNFIQDDARVFPEPRYQVHPIFTKTGHAFVGPGHLDIAGLLTDEANNIMRLWDTDVANVDATQAFVVELDINGTFTSFSGPIKFQNGCYVELSGTDPRGEVILTQNSDRPGVVGPKYHSDATIRRLGMQS